MKNGYKHKTGVFGSDAEAYVSRLFFMGRNPNGTRRPDLVSINGRYKPKLSIEVKSGRARKGVLVDYQLHYAVSSLDDYRELYGLDLSSPEGVMPGVDWATFLPQEKVAYYYDVITRSEKVKANDLTGRFSNIKLEWGDQHIVPHQFGFYSFAIAQHMRTREPLPQVIDSLWEMIKEDVIKGGSHYESRKSDKQSWQSLQGRDILAIFLNDDSVATEDGKRRIELMHRYYPGLDELKRVQIFGPNETTIYILAEPKHYRLFNEQLRGTVAERRKRMERVTQQRRAALGLLKRADIKNNSYFPLIDGESQKGISKKTLRQLKRLEMLAEWKNNADEDCEFAVEGSEEHRQPVADMANRYQSSEISSADNGNQQIEGVDAEGSFQDGEGDAQLVNQGAGKDKGSKDDIPF